MCCSGSLEGIDYAVSICIYYIVSCFLSHSLNLQVVFFWIFRPRFVVATLCIALIGTVFIIFCGLRKSSPQLPSDFKSIRVVEPPFLAEQFVTMDIYCR